MIHSNHSNEQCIDGIKCHVTNCHYHAGDCDCTAREIKVGPHHASCSADTVCDTFKPEEK